mmetsp:Transcript_7204/g.10717  ORF Transcript_7204/g.10717 Transcript_7204/m.10717 type:complete len:136 (+) Transcript_7204:77-484(+)
MAAWAVLVNFLFPIPLILLVMLSLPLPDFCRHSVRSVMLSIPLPGVINLSVFSLSMTLSTGLFILSALDTMHHHSKPTNQFNPQEQRCMRWRSERNFWISLLAFVVWLVLSRFKKALAESEHYRKEIKKLESKSK